jgi:Mn2+/Fe2+ NRAMP family transporter
VNYSPIDPIKALFWIAVINGVIAVPIMAAMMIVVSRRHEMGQFVGTLGQRLLGWAVTAIMALMATAMFFH